MKTTNKTSPLRPTLLAAATALATATLAATAQAGSLTEFTLTEGHPNVGTMSIDWGNMGTTNMRDHPLTSGSTSFRYVGQEFIVNTAGEYLLGQTAAPVDTVMLIFEGAFDPARPGNGWLTGNDDWINQLDDSDLSSELAAAGITLISCSSDAQQRPHRCPALKLSLSGDTRYTVVISTFSANMEIGFPQSFFVYGPDFVVLVGRGGLFEAPVEGQRSQPGGAYLDRVVSELGLHDPNSPLLQALTVLSAMDDAQRAQFVESMSSNVSRSGVRDATTNAGRTMLNTVGKRFASTGLGGQMSAGQLAPATFAGMAVERQQHRAVMPGMAPDNDPRSSILQYGDHDSVDGLLGLASQLSHQGASHIGQGSSWAEGFVSRGSGDDYDYRTHGALFGMDRRIDEHWLGGLFIGVGQGRVQGDDAASARTEIDSVTTGVYTARRQGNVILDATLLAGFSDNEHRREVAGLTPEIVEGSNRGEEVTLGLGASYVIERGHGLELVPHARLMHSWLHQSAYEESGDSALTMAYDSQRQQVWRTSLGLDAGHELHQTDQATILWTGGLAWGMRVQSGGGTQATLSADTTGDSFVISPDNRTVHSADINSGLRWERELNGHSSIAFSGSYEGSLSSRETEHGARLTMAYHW
ncbi:autotransporter outer membrane beta-barrel domain-containing protein [Billgrantia kenyensis]|uniref:Autotransporter outer membrane beta-barrel domain-containing protein n=1 Tax=Billgrantia kenyensis TaxID=321266 RepID=A0A7V9W123_9GAMM|nr:autotransporter outer membrane beta-barrel domain-containing protein [Halomonas kenyensis]MBA2779007.1 autotransporter outer membrane beta-barrel domain-containing protein [Halomonas kenyensis]MCG6662934.1 autotransporter outer membrane beta-barrel domain-containing protein [Halomonas kenyensis]